MLNTSIEIIDPADCFAVVVGVGLYATGHPLPSATENALAFSSMLGQLGVPASQIRLFVPEAPGGQFAAKYEGNPEFRRVIEFVQMELRRRTEGTLLFYWSGHGITSTSPNWYGRRLFTADYQLGAQWNVNFERLANYLREEPLESGIASRETPRAGRTFERQFFWVDACGITASALGWDREPPEFAAFPIGRTKARPPAQDILFSAADGRIKRGGEHGHSTLFTRTLIDLIATKSAINGHPTFSNSEIYTELSAALKRAKMTEPLKRISFSTARDIEVIGQGAASGGCYCLPRVTPTYLPREREFDAVMKALDARNRALGAAIVGPGGVGKSGLAAEVAAACWNEKKFGRVIWTTAKNEEFLPTEGRIKLRNAAEEKNNFSSSQVTEFSGLIDAILRATGNSSVCEASMNERVSEANLALQDVPCLLILDNVETLSSMESIKDFLGQTPVSTKLITTTRDARIRWLEEPVPLTPMSDVLATQLVDKLCSNKRISGIEPDDVGKILRLTGGIPLAIEWCVGRFPRTPGFLLELERFLKRPSHDGELERLLEYLFVASFDQLTAVSRFVLEVLGLISIPLRIDELRKVARLAVSEVEAALDELDQVSMLVKNAWVGSGNTKSYDVLPLVRRFVRTRITNERKQAILSRVAEERSASKGKICVFTPNFLPVMLPAGASALDFAYGVHTDIGHAFRAASADGIMLPANAKLHTGQVVVVQTTKDAEPESGWRNWVVSARAKRALYKFFNGEARIKRYVQNGNASALKRSAQTARLSFESAYRAFPNNIWACSRLAHQLRVDGDLDAAKVLFEKILVKEPANPYALSGLGALSYMRRDFEKGAHCYSRAVKRDATYVNARFGIARCQCHQGKYREALDALDHKAHPFTKRTRLWPSVMFVRSIAELALGTGETTRNSALSAALLEFDRLAKRTANGNRMASHFGFHYAYALACVGSANWVGIATQCLNPARGMARELEQDLFLLTTSIIETLDREVKLVFPRNDPRGCINALKCVLFPAK